jgi:hypothetical protein
MTDTERAAIAETLVDEGSFVAIVQRLYESAFTGETLIRWAEGHPRVVEIPCSPVRISLDSRRDRP